MNRSTVAAVMAVAFGLSWNRLHAEDLAKLPTPSELTVKAKNGWSTDYLAAIERAKEQKRLVLVWFFDEKQAEANAKFEATVLRSADLQSALTKLTLVKLPTTASIVEKEKDIELLKHSSFRELLGGPGLAMIDMRDSEQRFHGWVVSVYPFRRGPISAPKLKILCDLPAGTLSQRTLIFAVRTHPAAPQSAWSPHHNYLATEAEKHSQHQASINLQGHHNWESRFHQINAGIGAGSAKEVCAESWPGQSLLDAAEECVHSWSQSSGHWAGVSARHAFFGYDMKRGSNGVWYATGIFAGR
jgi:hypothetical protein